MTIPEEKKMVEDLTMMIRKAGWTDELYKILKGREGIDGGFKLGLMKVEFLDPEDFGRAIAEHDGYYVVCSPTHLTLASSNGRRNKG